MAVDINDIWGQSKNYGVIFTLTPNVDPKYNLD